MRKTKVKIRCVHVMIISLLIISLFIYEIIGKTKQKDIKVMCWAVGSKSVGLSWADADCVLLAPQSASELSKFEEMVHGVIPCALINENDFIEMNGEAVLNQALDLIKK